MRDCQQDMRSLLFVDDPIFVEHRVEMRPGVCVSCWESICRRRLGGDSSNKDNLMEAGEWGDTHILLGYEVNADALTIRLPNAKVGGAWGVINDPVFQPGNRAIPAKQVQILRGLINHRSDPDRFL